jgi:hypothetical protein
VSLSAVPVRTASHSKSQDEISVRGEGYDTPSVTVAASVFYSTSAVQSTLYLGLKFIVEVKSFL